MTIHQLDDTDFAIETNLEELLGLRHPDQHTIVERALLAVAGLEQRIEEIMTHTALPGFQDDSCLCLKASWPS